ncbi:MAG: hypothetical protein IPJ52_05735 [Rhodocyclaceae bacterium]|nr:hypothetical protein [Rhodocyclaceae bacterium]
MFNVKGAAGNSRRVDRQQEQRLRRAPDHPRRRPRGGLGIREIMVLRPGVPLSDPDSFTRLDFVDTLDL